jgi:hypothetical protein
MEKSTDLHRTLFINCVKKMPLDSLLTLHIWSMLDFGYMTITNLKVKKSM